MTIRMGYWDCPSCGTKKNLGPNATCTSCGRPRGPNIPFYTDDSAPIVEDAELVARARAGADWKCKYCGADNRAGKMDCHQCGAGPDGAVRRQEQFIPDVVKAPAPAKRGPSPALVLGVLLGLLTLIGAAVWFLFVRTTALHVTVRSASWVKTAQIEERQTKAEGAWEDEVPSGVRVVGKEPRRRSKQVADGTKKVKVGKKDLGNGMFEDIYEDKPNMVTKEVDDTWVRYEVDTWVKKGTLEKRTTDGTEPPDPSRDFTPTSARRLGAKTNDAVFELEGSDGKAYTFEVDASHEGASAVTKYQVGKTYVANVNAMGKVLSLGP